MLVRRWVEGEKVPGAPVSPAYPFQFEGILARLRTPDVAWPRRDRRPDLTELAHKNNQPWNLLAREGRPVVLDWELSGMVDLSSQLGWTALSLAQGTSRAAPVDGRLMRPPVQGELYAWRVGLKCRLGYEEALGSA